MSGNIPCLTQASNISLRFRQITRGAANHYCWFFLRHVLIPILNFILMCVEGGDGLVGGLDGTQVDRFARMFL